MRIHKLKAELEMNASQTGNGTICWALTSWVEMSLSSSTLIK